MPVVAIYPPRTYEELRAAAERHDGLFLTDMQTLRNLDRSQRLTGNVIARVEASLNRHGLKHLPATLTLHQQAEVWIYVPGTPLANLFNAVLNPSRSGDSLLRQFAKTGIDARPSRVE